jgi:glyoxylase-like metal-dependent hydrolase (beta-lactamase superfamily II)
VKLTQEKKNLFRLTRFGVVNCFLVKEDDGFTLVDTNLTGSAPAILKMAQRLGAPIRRIALTHAHIDHCILFIGKNVKAAADLLPRFSLGAWAPSVIYQE